MTSTNGEVPDDYQAPQACRNCKTRKKKCDKKIPSCGNCVFRSALCQYGEEIPVYVPETPTVSSLWARPSRPLVSSSVSPGPKVANELPTSISSSLLLMDSLSDMRPSQLLDLHLLAESATNDSVLYSQVCRIIRAHGQYIDDVTVRYFQGLHRWMPVISRRLFHDRLIGSKGFPPSDISILLLGMCLLAVIPSEKSGDRETLYLTTKMLFAQVQATTSYSTTTIQAGLLIATYEITYGRHESASLTIGTCAQLAVAMGLDKKTHVGKLRDYEEWLRVEEERNLWWGVVIAERVIACESMSISQNLITKFPDIEDELPSEAENLDHITGAEAGSGNHRAVSSLWNDNVGIIGTFGREAQATYLLDKVFTAMGIAELETRLSELSQIDADLQKFLSVVLDQAGKTWGLYCGAVAVAISALYGLHRQIINLVSANGDMTTLQNSSWAALSTITRIVIDVAYDINTMKPKADVDILPSACSHMMRAAQRHLHLAQDLQNEAWVQDFGELRKAAQRFSERWGTHSS